MKKRLTSLVLLLAVNLLPAVSEASVDLVPIFGLRAGIARSYDPDRLADGPVLEMLGGVAISQKVAVRLSVHRTRHETRWLAFREQETSGHSFSFQTSDLTVHAVNLNVRPLLWAERTIRPVLETSFGLTRWKAEEPLLEITTVEGGTTEETFSPAIVDWGGIFGIGVGFDVELAPHTRLEILVNGRAVTHLGDEGNRMWGVGTSETYLSFIAGIQRSW